MSVESKSQPVITSPDSYWVDQGWVQVGRVMDTLGTDGSLKLKPYDPEPDWLEAEALWLTPIEGSKAARELKKSEDDPGQRFTVEAINSMGGGRITLKVSGLDTLEAARLWSGSTVWLPQTQLPQPEAGNFRTIDLVGLSVMAEGQPEKRWGTVTAVISGRGCSYDFLEVTLEPTEKTTLIPFTEHFVPFVNVKDKLLTVQGLDSLLDELTQCEVE